MDFVSEHRVTKIDSVLMGSKALRTYGLRAEHRVTKILEFDISLVYYFQYSKTDTLNNNYC